MSAKSYKFVALSHYMVHDAGSGEMLAAMLPSESANLMTALRIIPRDAHTSS